MKASRGLHTQTAGIHLSPACMCSHVFAKVEQVITLRGSSTNGHRGIRCGTAHLPLNHSPAHRALTSLVTETNRRNHKNEQVLLYSLGEGCNGHLCRWKKANSCVGLLSNKWPQTFFCSHMTPDCCLMQYRAQFEGLIDQDCAEVTVWTCTAACRAQQGQLS